MPQVSDKSLVHKFLPLNNHLICSFFPLQTVYISSFPVSFDDEISVTTLKTPLSCLPVLCSNVIIWWLCVQNSSDDILCRVFSTLITRLRIICEPLPVILYCNSLSPQIDTNNGRLSTSSVSVLFLASFILPLQAAIAVASSHSSS